MSVEKTLERTAVHAPQAKDAWPDWVFKHVDRRKPFRVSGIGSAINTHNRSLVLIFTSKNKDIKHFEFTREQTEGMIEMLQDALGAL